MSPDFNELPAHVWPRNARREEDGVVTIAGVPVTELVREFGTPLYVFDEDDFRSRCREMAQAFGGPGHVHYASKAFLTKRVAGWVNEEGLALDVASINEMKIALAAGFPATRMTAHGNNKLRDYLELCVDEGAGHVVLDNFVELELLNEVAAAAGKVQPVMIRVKPGVEAHTHEFIATAHEDQKFGFSLASGEALDAARRCLESSNLKLVGLHCHVGSSVFDAEGFKLAAERVLGLYKQLHRELGVDLPELDLGGGFGIPYMEYEEALDVAALAQDLLAAVERTAGELGIAPPSILVEPGRSLVGASAVALYTVGTVKDVETGKDELPIRRYLAVDGGMSDNIRPALYGSAYDVRAVGRFTDGELRDSRVVGFHCESGDILIDSRRLPADITTGDILGIPTAGAYQYMMASRYNGALRPAVVSVRNGVTRLMVRRETLEDLLALEED